MKKNVLALSIAAMVGGLGFAGAASAALSVNESGTGHILMVPYYTAQNGNMTVFHLTNTDTLHGKAVKVRFRGASNSDDVLDFQVFMSPGDVWTAAVTADANGLSQLVTADNTCTLPRISAGTPVKFVTDRLAKTDWTASDKAAQTREGYVEILNMADIPDNNGDKGLFKAIKHVNGVAPCTSGILNATLSLTGVGPGATNLNLPNNTAADLTVPTGGLTGSWYVMNVAQTTTFSGATPAIVASGATRNVFSHQKTGTALLETADPLMVGGAIPTQHYDVPDLSTPYEVAATTAAAQASDLTTAIARTSVINQYATDASISAKTDWVFSMPTRRYTIAANYAAGAVNQVVGNVTGTSLAGGTVTVPAGSAAAYRFINNNIPVANNIFRTAGNTTVNNAGQICVEAQSQTFYDREERFQEDGAIFSPGTISKTQLCGEVSVLAFSADTSALAASVARQNVAAPYTNGWGVVNFNAPTPPAGRCIPEADQPPSCSWHFGHVRHHLAPRLPLIGHFHTQV